MQFYRTKLPWITGIECIIRIDSVMMCCLVEVYEENSTSHKQLTLKEKSILTSFLSNCGYSLRLHQNSTHFSSKQELQCGIWNCQWTFCTLLTLKFIECIFTYGWFWNMMHLVIWKISVHWITQIFQELTHLIIQYPKWMQKIINKISTFQKKRQDQESLVFLLLQATIWVGSMLTEFCL